jgi:hypothetical protein
MRIWDYSRSAFGTCAAAAMLAGCGGSHPSIGMPGAMPQTTALQSESTQRDDRGSWMLPEAKEHDLLYLASPNLGEVFVYTYPEGKPTGTLTGLFGAAGECVDAKGNVFVTSRTSGSTSGIIYEYAHGGTNPIATLDDPGIALGCAVDTTTGNLAISNGADASNPNGPYYGDVAIYKGAKGNPTMYYGSAVNFYLCGYDSSGNLYISGDGPAAGEVGLFRLESGSGDFQEITVNKTLYNADEFFPSVQWDGAHMTVSSDPRNKRGKNQGWLDVYRLSIVGSSGKVIGTTRLVEPKKKSHYTGQIWIYRRTVVGIGYDHLFSFSPEASLWRYPEGGLPRQQIAIQQDLVWGVTVSPASPVTP